MIVTLGVEGMKMLIHMLFSIFSTICCCCFLYFHILFLLLQMNTMEIILEYHELKHRGKCFMHDVLHFYVSREFPDKVASMFAMIELFFGIGKLERTTLDVDRPSSTNLQQLRQQEQ